MEFKDGIQGLLQDTRRGQDGHRREIKKAFRKLARKHHPDVSKLANAHESMAAVNEAHEVFCVTGRSSPLPMLEILAASSPPDETRQPFTVSAT